MSFSRLNLELPQVYSRRSALRLAITAVPAVAALALLPTTSRAAAAAGGVEVIPAQYRVEPGLTKPNAANTGVRFGSVLTKYNGDLILNRPGIVVENLDISGVVKFQASNCTLRNCVVRGGPTTAYGTMYPLIRAYTNGVSGSLIEDCEIAPSHPSVDIYGMHGFDYTIRRSNIHSTTDGIVAFRQNVLVESCYIWDIRRYSVDPRQTDGSHSDGIQLQGGTNMGIIGNTFDCPRDGSAAIMVTQDDSPLNSVEISRNWLNGGNNHINFYDKTFKRADRTAAKNVTISGNRSGTLTRSGIKIRVEAPTYDLNVARFTGNVNEADGSPVAVTRGVQY